MKTIDEYEIILRVETRFANMSSAAMPLGIAIIYLLQKEERVYFSRFLVFFFQTYQILTRTRPLMLTVYFLSRTCHGFRSRVRIQRIVQLSNQIVQIIISEKMVFWTLSIYQHCIKIPLQYIHMSIHFYGLCNRRMLECCSTGTCVTYFFRNGVGGAQTKIKLHNIQHTPLQEKLMNIFRVIYILKENFQQRIQNFLRRR